MFAPRMQRSLSTCGLFGVLLAMIACGAQRGADTTATFAGETVRIIVGFAPGGGYDLHARLVAAHLGQYLPGRPTVIVENMPGAGGALAANYVATAAAPDGLSVGLIGEASAPDLVASKLLDRLALLGSPGATLPVIAFTRKSGISSVEDWRRAATPPRVGSNGGRALSAVVPRVAAATLGLPARMVSGYAGTSEIRLALASGEVDAYAFDASVGRSDQLGDATIVLRFGPPLAQRADIPDALSLAPDAHARGLLEAGVYDMRPFGRVFIAPRGVTGARLALLRAGLARAWADAAFLAEAKAANLLIAPISAEALEQSVAKLSESRDAIPGLRDMLRVD